MVAILILCSFLSAISVTALLSVNRQILGGNVRHSTRLMSSPDGNSPASIKRLSQIATLNSMATKLRAEAAELEVPSTSKTSYLSFTADLPQYLFKILYLKG